MILPAWDGSGKDPNLIQSPKDSQINPWVELDIQIQRNVWPEKELVYFEHDLFMSMCSWLLRANNSPVKSKINGKENEPWTEDRIQKALPVWCSTMYYQWLSLVLGKEVKRPEYREWEHDGKNHSLGDIREREIDSDSV